MGLETSGVENLEYKKTNLQLHIVKKGKRIKRTTTPTNNYKNQKKKS